MKFGPVVVEQAEGAVLAHSLTVAGKRWKKGHVLTAGDLAALEADGISQVIVARLDPDDIDEDAAAQALAQALVAAPGTGLRLGAASTGRVNLYADLPGIVQVNAAQILAVNSVDPGITVATVPEWQRVGPRNLVATIKIIAYGVPRDALTRACDRGLGALSLRQITRKRVTLIQTAVGPGEDGQKGQRVTADRVTRLGGTLAADITVVPHAVAPLSAALTQALPNSDALLILTGSATSDIGDVAPEAVRQAGGTVAHYGMPVDPGNLLFFGDIGAVPVIGLPGCARSPALNGADWVLERILCGVPVTPGDIAGMGVGGLLKEIPTRPRPREG